MRTRKVCGLVLSLCAAVLAAAEPSPESRKWPSFPEAYFLTSSERAEWKEVRTEEQAREFVTRYYAGRATDLPQVLRERIAVADKYFTSGKTRGSETMRGKVIILFGPPSEMTSKNGLENSGGGGASDRASVTSGVSDPHANVGPGTRGLAQSAVNPIFSFIYDEAHAPKAIGKAFRIDLKMKSGARQEPVDPKDLDEKFEAVARASRVRPQ